MSKKRSLNHEERQLQIFVNSQINTKKLKSNLHQNSTDTEIQPETEIDIITDAFVEKLDDNLLYEIFKRADARSLASFSCVSKIWNRTAQDERLWELICKRRWIDVNHTGGEKQLRSVVLALGGFRRLYSLYLSKTVGPTTVVPPIAAARGRGSKRRGKDEVNLSLSLLSIQFYEKLNNKGK